MPKRKRTSSQEKIDKYKKKLKKLEEKCRKEVRIESSSDKEIEHTHILNEDPCAEEDSLPIINANHQEQDPALEPTSNDVPLDPIPVQEVNDLPELDPQLLLALGETTNNTDKFGEKIHHSLAERWEPILKKGLPKDTKNKLLKEYLIPENCTLLQAPKLNVEVAAAISEASRSRDKRKESAQQQLGVGVSIISKAMTILLTSENKIEAIKFLSDGCRILSDLHYEESQSRISVTNYALAKPFLKVVQDNERDETLYGNKLSENIKASKVIEKQGMQIKKYNKTQKSSATEQTTNIRPYSHQVPTTSNPGNWSGAPRFQQNRGERRGMRRIAAAPSRRPPPLPPASNAAGQARTRAFSRL